MKQTVAVLALVCSLPAWAQEQPRYAVILTDPVSVSASAHARVLSAQEAMKRELATRGVRITGSSHALLNAVYIAADPGEAERLRSLPGVKQVAPLHRFQQTLDRAEQLIDVPAAWSLLGGITNAGAGIKIGIIDTGIQATHPAFQDKSLTPPPGFPLCTVTYVVANRLAPLDCAASDFTNNKVIVARSYVPLLARGSSASSRPDDTSPRDRVGHGTAVAMAAAGLTNTGPSDTITGVAPKAFLGSYKVFGSPGVNDFTTGDVLIQAIEDAFTDGMDIVVMSLGAPALSGPLDTGSACGLSLGQWCDAEAYVVQYVADHGMVVVSAAGNAGQTGQLLQPALNTMDSPGDAPGAIAVAATTNSHSWGNILTVTGLGTYHARFGDGPAPGGTVTGSVGDVAAVGDPLACTAPPAGSLKGLIALVQRGTCTFAIKIQNLQNAGATGAIITNNPGDDTLLTPSGLSGTAIPAVFIGNSDGAAVRSFLVGNPRASVSIPPNFSPFDIATYNQVAPFSSRGPTLGTGGLKPDVAAVGVDLYLAGQSYDPNGALYAASGYLVSQGTSFSTPQIAGVAALVKQAYPNLTPSQIKSAIMNTATRDVTENGIAASVLSVGAGKANAAFAVANTLLASPSSSSFGVITASSLPLTQSIQLTNIGGSALQLGVALARRTPESAAHTSIDLPNLTLAAGQTSNINLTLSGTLPAPGLYEGFVNIQGAANPINIPYLYLVGDGIPKNLISLSGNGDDGTVGQPTAGSYVILEVIDQYGVPVPDLPVTFTVTSGGGRLQPIAKTTNNYGIAAAQATLGPTPGTNVYTASAGGLTATFQATGQPQPVITPGGVVTAGTYSTQMPAPGSYISIFGTNLARTTATYTTPYLPISLGRVSVSFDNPNASVPGHIVFVSPGQVNVQIPWELQGQPSIQIKVSDGDSSGVVYTTPLGAYSPELFQTTSGAAALDERNNVVSAANPVARGHVVQLFANGLGPVNNQPASGDPAPSGLLAETTTTPTVTIGNMPAQVRFSGMTPGNAGLYQINAVVPDTGAGLQPITVSIGGITSPASILPVQ